MPYLYVVLFFFKLSSIMWYELIQYCVIYFGKLAGSGTALKFQVKEVCSLSVSRGGTTSCCLCNACLPFTCES